MELTSVLKHMNLFILVQIFLLLKNTVNAFILGGLQMLNKQQLKKLLKENPEAMVITTYISVLALLTIAFI